MPIYQRISEKLQDERKALTEPAKLPPEDQLARAHGVTRQTIRRALGLLENDGAVTRQRKVGTFLQPERPQSVALRGGHIGMVAPWWSDSDQSWLTSRVFDAVSREAHRRGAYASIVHVDREPTEIGKWINEMHDRKIIGLVWLHPKGRMQQQLIERVSKDLPNVVMTRQFESDDLHYVLPDYDAAAMIMDKQLAAKGHETYAVIGGRSLDPHFHFWIDAFERAHAQRGSMFDWVERYMDIGSFPRSSFGELLTNHYLASHPEIEALALTSSSYLLSMVNYRPLLELMKDRLSIITIDIGLYPIDAYWIGHDISHVACNWRGIAQQAIETIGTLIEGKPAPKHKYVPVTSHEGQTIYPYRNDLS